MESKSYLCPNCGAPMIFDSSSQKMLCEHCGASMNTGELDKIYEDAKAMYEDSTSPQEEDSIYGEFENSGKTGEFKVYRCGGCGAEILTDENTASTFCGFCGRPTMMEDRLSGQLMPEYVIPFKIQKDQAVEAYKKWTAKGLATPSELKSKAMIDKITGIYVPFWLYDYNAEMTLKAKCKRVTKEVSGSYEITNTYHYIVDRDVECEYLKIPADASEKMPDDVMDKLEPFHYGEMIGFEMPYLSGYYAEKFNYTGEQMAGRVESRVRNYIKDATMGTIVGYNTVNVIHQNVRLGRRKASYALLPIWMLNYTYGDKKYMFALNGQTGKIVADRPISKKKVWGWFAGVSAIAFAILYAIGGVL